jgi:site-specific DNA-methyltransferase (adenine-specific)
MGSGTTGIACMQEERKFIGIEKDEKYFEIASKRMQDEYKKSKTH